MDDRTLISNYPRLFHMASAGSWDSIRAFGLLPTSQLVESAGLDDAEQSALLHERRPKTVTFTHPEIGRVSVRDQGPLTLSHLRRSLTDMTEKEWFDVLNGRVFFWLHPNRLSELLQARNYRELEQDVLTVDTATLITAYREAVRLSPINSGATLWPTAVKRGSDTFQSIEDYDYADRRRGRTVQKAIAELAVVGGVPNVVDFTLRVDRYLGPQRLHTIYEAN